MNKSHLLEYRHRIRDLHMITGLGIYDDITLTAVNIETLHWGLYPWQGFASTDIMRGDIADYPFFNLRFRGKWVKIYILFVHSFTGWPGASLPVVFEGKPAERLEGVDLSHFFIYYHVLHQFYIHSTFLSKFFLSINGIHATLIKTMVCFSVQDVLNVTTSGHMIPHH